MRVFVAGASGVIGRPLLPLLVEAGHEVAGLTRSQGELVRSLGAQPVVCDVFDREALIAAVHAFEPDALVHLLTDLPDDEARLPEFGAANARIRREGTRNLLDAAPGAFVVAQSVAFPLAGEGAAAVAELERLVMEAGGVVLRWGRLYGPGTYHESDLPPEPRTSVEEAARAVLAAFGS